MKRLKVPKQLLVWLHISIWCLFFTLYWSKAYVVRDGQIIAKSLGVWADGAAHLTYISSMSFRDVFPSQLPTFLGHAFVYPFIADGLSALFVRLGVNIFIAYSLIGLVLSWITVYMVYQFFYVFTNQNTKASVLGLHIFLCSGGMGFVYFLFDLHRQGWKIFQAIPKEYTRLDQENIWWLNIITGELIPQRAMLLGIPLGLWVLIQLYRMHTQRNSVKPYQFIISGVILGLMPIIHPHSLIALTGIIGIFFLWDVWKRRSITEWLLLGLPAVIIGLPLTFGHIFQNTGDKFIQFKPGWLAATNNVNWIWFWLKNWGLFPILVILGVTALTKLQKILVFSYLFLFVVCNLFWFQPYDWDNSKILTWVYLGLSPVVGLYLAGLWQTTIFKKIISVVFFLVIIATGVLDITRQLQSHLDITMYSNEDLEVAEFVKQQTASDSVFLTSDLHTHPIPTLTGRQIVMGYRGWLWSYGVDYAQREKDVALIYQGSDMALNLIRNYGIDYVFIGSSEQERFGANRQFFMDKFPIFLQTDNYVIYQVNKL